MYQQSYKILFLFIILSFFVPDKIYPQRVTVKAKVESNKVFIGQTFKMEIEIKGSNGSKAPEIKDLPDFKIIYIGAQNNSSESITIINGHVTKLVNKGYSFLYQLTPIKTGISIIPALEIDVDGTKLQTRPIRIFVKKAEENEYFKLRFITDKKQYYVGEPIQLKVKWYLSKNVQEYNFNLPVFNDKRFHQINPKIERYAGVKYYSLNVEGNHVIAGQDQEKLDGEDYTTFTFQRILIPRYEGKIELQQGSVICKALMGYKQRSRGRFSDFFDDDFGAFGHNRVYKKFVSPSNTIKLNILPLPTQNQPDNFAGHIGNYKIETSAKPTDVNVGTPITFTVKISGPNYLEHIKLPDLKSMGLSEKDFKIPKDRASGEIKGNEKIFRQTIRAKHSNIKEIPSLKLVYFDTDKEKYLIAKSKPIPLKVKQTKIVTLKNVKGDQSITDKSEVKSFTKGIAFNYENLSVLENQNYGFRTFLEKPAWLLALTVPFGIYMILFLALFLKNIKTDPVNQRYKKAYKIFNMELKKIQKNSMKSSVLYSELLSILREYLKNKLKMLKVGLTYKEIEVELAKYEKVNNLTINNLKELFDQCEAGCYAGNIGKLNDDQLIDKAIMVTKDLERSLR